MKNIPNKPLYNFLRLSKMKKNRIYIVSFLLVILIISAFMSNYAIKNIAPYAIIKPYRAINHELNTYLREHHTRLEIITKDSINLIGYFIKSKKNIVKGTVIILHGIGDSKESQLGMAEFLSNNGYNSIIFDLRAHGESGGKYCTYGYYEKQDVSRIIDYAVNEIPNLKEIGIMGTSLGGAIAIQSMAFDKRIKCGVVVSTFSSLNQISYDYMKRMLYVPFKFVSDLALDEASKIAKFPANKINPKDYAKDITQPILVMHGNIDDRINIKYGKEIFNNIKSANKEFYEIKNASHININQAGGNKYREEILNFFNMYLQPK